MAFTTQAKPKGMPAPGEKKPGLMVAISAGPKGAPDDPNAPPDDPNGGGGEKHELESAGVIRADKHCKDCGNYDTATGDCSELPGSWDPDDACLRYFKALGEGDDEEQEPDADDTAMPMSGAPADTMAGR